MYKYKIVIITILFLGVSTLYAQRVKILTYNIHHANPPSEPNKIDLESIAKVIKASDADIVGVQEVDVNVSRSLNQDQAKKMAELTGMHYFFSKGIDLEEGEYGVVILTKHKVVAQRRYDLPMPRESENRSLAIIDVEMPGGEIISLANTHLDLYEENRLAQVAYINELAEWYSRPLILVGDLNAKPDSAPIRLLEEKFTRNTELNQPTFPNIDASTEIDYIMLNRKTNFKWLSYTTLDETYASDHLPLFAEIEID
ncbi:endonuclease/exonuclease/phosphatase family protein [Sphingobacterium sp. UT-1RO-CII-1]|uniref:endonuclease/exonuclease/phosphatase family protein n=1 Tax=Sphingobacterium sp. UT-1RO-CII-1 TaxID=2995225 RepID=UPI00227C96E0|nr:endonuclease/exonuclease/phosphatase family protein [Sphingobacterium sp. UT-1RO-CII-1]MCY4781015.1 endonuclease/exonuclease/phosphatase family protein [Sphingobacterium sp. UT-1RO-CII-1]